MCKPARPNKNLAQQQLASLTDELKEYDRQSDAKPQMAGRHTRQPAVSLQNFPVTRQPFGKCQLVLMAKRYRWCLVQLQANGLDVLEKIPREQFTPANTCPVCQKSFLWKLGACATACILWDGLFLSI